MLLTPFGFVIRQRTILNPRTTNCSTKYPSKTIDGTANLIYEIRCWITNWKMPSFVVPGFLYHLDYLLIRSVTIIAAILFTKFIILWIRKKSTPILMFYKIGEDWSKVAIKKEATRHTTNTRELRLCLWKVDLVEAFSADSPLTLVDICGSSLVWQLDVVNLFRNQIILKTVTIRLRAYNKEEVRWNSMDDFKTRKFQSFGGGQTKFPRYIGYIN